MANSVENLKNRKYKRPELLWLNLILQMCPVTFPVISFSLLAICPIEVQCHSSPLDSYFESTSADFALENCHNSSCRHANPLPSPPRPSQQKKKKKTHPNKFTATKNTRNQGHASARIMLLSLQPFLCLC